MSMSVWNIWKKPSSCITMTFCSNIHGPHREFYWLWWSPSVIQWNTLMEASFSSNSKQWPRHRRGSLVHIPFLRQSPGALIAAAWGLVVRQSSNQDNMLADLGIMLTFLQNNSHIIPNICLWPPRHVWSWRRWWWRYRHDGYYANDTSLRLCFNIITTEYFFQDDF